MKKAEQTEKSTALLRSMKHDIYGKLLLSKFKRQVNTENHNKPEKKLIN